MGHREDKEVKMVIVMRRDLKMRRGKEIAQGAHAALAWVWNNITEGRGRFDMTLPQRLWVTDSGEKKVTCRIDSEQELIDLYLRAKAAGLTAYIVTDSGHTEFHGQETKTCLAIGPNYAEDINKLTDGLTLY